MSIGIAYNPCKNCKDMDKCSICELTYYRKGQIESSTADVVEVVRCKDCCRWERYENTSGAGYCHNKKFCFTYGAMLDREFSPITMPDDYCSYGEKERR